MILASLVCLDDLGVPGGLDDLGVPGGLDDLGVPGGQDDLGVPGGQDDLGVPGGLVKNPFIRGGGRGFEHLLLAT